MQYEKRYQGGQRVNQRTVHGIQASYRKVSNSPWRWNVEIFVPSAWSIRTSSHPFVESITYVDPPSLLASLPYRGGQQDGAHHRRKDLRTTIRPRTHHAFTLSHVTCSQYRDQDIKTSCHRSTALPLNDSAR